MLREWKSRRSRWQILWRWAKSDALSIAGSYATFLFGVYMRVFVHGVLSARVKEALLRGVGGVDDTTNTEPEMGRSTNVSVCVRRSSEDLFTRWICLKILKSHHRDVPGEEAGLRRPYFGRDRLWPYAPRLHSKIWGVHLRHDPWMGYCLCKIPTFFFFL